MAIYSLSLRSIGRSTQKAPYTAAAGLRYIARKAACSELLSEHTPPCVPGGTKAAEAWLRAEENHDRRNGRVAARIIVALPLELDHAAQRILVQTFAQSLGHGRVPWFAGLHNGPQDARNPHAHLLVRDRDFETGKRVVGLSNKDAGHKVRALWTKVCNDALRAQGVST